MIEGLIGAVKGIIIGSIIGSVLGTWIVTITDLYAMDACQEKYEVCVKTNEGWKEYEEPRN